MLIAFGTYHLFRKLKISERATCPHCKSPSVVLDRYTAYKFFHLCFIPLIPMGKNRLVLVCQGCQECYKFAADDSKLQEIIAQRRSAARSNIAANLDLAIGDIAAMAHWGDIEGVEAHIEALKTASKIAWTVGRARLADLQSNRQEAESLFREAVVADPVSGMPDFWFGRFLLHDAKDEEGLAHLRRAARMNAQYEYSVLIEEMMQRRHRQKHWSGLAILMNELQRLYPMQCQTEAFQKLLAKACKKSGRNHEPANPYARL